MMKPDHTLEIPVGVSLTHDKGHPIIFAYVGGKGRLGMRAKRFNPRVLGSIERALRQAIRWRKQALREHTAAVAALPARELPKTPVKKRPPALKANRRTKVAGKKIANTSASTRSTKPAGKPRRRAKTPA